MKKERMHLGTSGLMFERAQSLRETATLAEKLLWGRLSKNQMGSKFRRQHPILNYIVDFYCHAFKFAVELEGSVHENAERRFHDRMRTEALSVHGITVIRFSNEEVISNIDQVIEAIKAHMNQQQ